MIITFLFNVTINGNEKKCKYFFLIHVVDSRLNYYIIFYIIVK